MRIGVDLDGVLYDFQGAMIDYLAYRSPFIGAKEQLKRKLLPTWRFYEGWGMTDSEFLDAYAAGVDAGWVLWTGAPLVSYKEVDDIRRTGHEVFIITDRSVGKLPQTATRAWLDQYGFIYDELHFNADKTIVPTDMFIDDKLENYDALHAAGTEVYLLNRPWNTVPGGDYRRRVDTFTEFVGKVLERTNREREMSNSEEVRVTSSTGGQKGTKLARYGLIPTGPLRELAEHYGKGAKKYSDNNWRLGYDWHLSYDALQRHAQAFWDGEDVDEETGSHHLAGVAFHAFALMEFGNTHPEFDDRPNKTYWKQAA